MNKRKITVKQHDLTDCAVACLSSVAAFYGLRLPLIRIRQACGASIEGTTIKGIVEAAAQMGLKARGLRSPEKKLVPLRALMGPFIAHVQRENGDLHFVVVYTIGKDKVEIMDPGPGEMRKMPFDTFCRMWSGYIVTLEPSADFRKGDNTTGTLRRMMSLVRANRKDLGALLAGSMVYITIGVSLSVFLQHILDNVIPSGDRAALAATMFLMTLVMACMLVIGYRRIIRGARVGIRIDNTLILTYITHLFSLPVGFFSTRDSGELNSRISDAFKVREFVAGSLISVIISALTLLLSIVLMFGYHWRLALGVLLFVPIYGLIYFFADKVNRRVNREVIESAAEFEARTVEGISSIRTIKHFSAEKSFAGRIENSYTDLANRMYGAACNIGAFATAADATTKVLTLTVIAFGSTLVFGGELTPGKFVLFYTLISYFSAPMAELVNLNRTMTEAKIASDRLFEIMDLEPENASPVTGWFPEGPQAISVDRLNFSYPGREQVLTDVSLTLEPGTITAITGESGCGKSTLAALLLRDFKAPAGSITISGTDIGQLDIEKWRKYVSCVPQSPELVSGTILDNITSGSGDEDMEKVVEICRSLGILDFITHLPLGFLSRAGERGCALSGGQQQRLALARALYRDPQLLILDEATSSLDAESERFILSKIDALREEGKTILMITHKLGNLDKADNTINLSGRSEGGNLRT